MFEVRTDCRHKAEWTPLWTVPALDPVLRNNGAQRLEVRKRLIDWRSFVLAEWNRKRKIVPILWIVSFLQVTRLRYMLYKTKTFLCAALP